MLKLVTFIHNYTTWVELNYPDNLLTINFYQPQGSHSPDVLTMLQGKDLKATQDSDLRLFLPEFCKLSWDHHPSAFSPVSSLPSDHPYFLPPKLQIAPLFLVSGSSVLAVMLSEKRFELTLEPAALAQLRMPDKPYYPCGDLSEIEEIFIQQKLRFLLSPYPRKVFYGSTPEELAFLSRIRSTLADPIFWLILHPSLSQVNKTVLRRQNFVFCDPPAVPILKLSEIQQALEDTKVQTPYYTNIQNFDDLCL